MLGIKQGGDDGIQPNRFTLTRSTGNKKVGHLGKVKCHCIV